ncbi:MAG: penicillin acylase family protein [Gemmatimonadota bacterium]
MSGRPAGRIIAEALHLLIWLAGIGITAAFFYLRSSAAEPEGTLLLSGAGRPVLVLVDSFDIPHLFAESEADLYRAQGYLHATDRLWQMELFRRTASGRLTELFGERALAADRFVRTLDLWGAAARGLETLDAGERALLEAYAEGVNARIRSWKGALPPEFVLLRFRSEPWSPQASLAVGMMMNLDLSHWRNDLRRFSAKSRLPPAKLGYLRLPFPAWGPTILEDSVPVPPYPGSPPSRGAEAFPDRAAHARHVTGSRGASDSEWDPFALLGGYSLRVASNAWAVSGERTATGGALLANDMHLGLRAPAIWYLSALHADRAGIHVAGITLPGVPGVVVGYTRGVAWGFTNGMIDDMDFVIEEVSEDGSSYRDAGRWREFTVRPETLRVRGRSEPVVHRVRETSRGPVITDVLAGLGATLSAVWVPARPAWSTIGILGLNRATDLESMDRAVRRFAVPHQNVVFATTSGRIGYRLAGTIPLRAGWDGSIPVPHEVVERRAPAFWPPEAHPAGRDPTRGFFATANNLQARGLDGVLGVDYPPPFRARRISDRLAEEAAWTADETYLLQRDTRSLLADRVIDRAVSAARAIGAESVADLLEGWNRRVSLDSRAAPIFYAWLYRLRALVAADEFAEAPEWAFYPVNGFLRTLELGDADPWVDDITTREVETLDGLSARAMRDVLPRVREREWGELHLERSHHLLGGSPWLDRLFGFDIGPYPGPGAPHTVRPDAYDRWTALDSTSWSPPYLSEYGPSERFVAEVGPHGILGRFLLPTGQSGNPFSPHYRDMNVRWREGGPLIPVPLDGTAARRRAIRQFRLVPDEG